MKKDCVTSSMMSYIYILEIKSLVVGGEMRKWCVFFLFISTKLY